MFESKTTEPITNGEVPSQPETETVKQEGTWQKKNFSSTSLSKYQNLYLGPKTKPIAVTLL